ncbi:MAG TPA: hypothetical protein VGL39_28165 [Jatrophihabitantaceae bacterium]
MSSKRRQRRKACLGKVRYPGPNPADAAAQRGAHRGHWLHAYRCPHCTGWHIGHLPARQRQAARDTARERRRTT